MSASNETRGLPTATSLAEKRLIRAAKRGDPAAREQLLRLYEPLVQRVARRLYLQGGEREDLAQHARLGILDAVRCWDPRRPVPFRAFAWLCAAREAGMAVQAARAHKHEPLNRSRPLHRVDDGGRPLEETLEANARPDEDPVAKVIARERLREIVDRLPALSRLERDALALSASDRPHREIADTLGVGQRAVNNALQRARGKLNGRIAAGPARAAFHPHSSSISGVLRLAGHQALTREGPAEAP
jgi:RNA polymerase sporulation-specific sigma factor